MIAEGARLLMGRLGVCPNADVNDAGGVARQDLFDVLRPWFAGCSEVLTGAWPA